MVISPKIIQRGFTLIELLVVIVIIGILATLTTISFSSARGKARDAKRVSDVKQLKTALDLYHADYNTFPQPNLVQGNLPFEVSGKTYMAKVPTDPQTNQVYGYFPIGYNDYQLIYSLEKDTANLSSGVVINSVAGSSQISGLTAWWLLNGSAQGQDISGNANNGTIIGATSTTGRYGEVGGAYSFDGIDDEFRVIPKAPINIRTLVFNINISSGAWDNNTLNYIYDLREDNAIFVYITNALALASSGTSSMSIDGEIRVILYDNLPKDKFISLAFVLNTNYTNTDLITFMTRYQTAARHLEGVLSEIRIYNRVLTASELIAISNSLSP